MDRRTFAVSLAAGLAPLPSVAQSVAQSTDQSGGPKVLRYAFPTAETGFDPAQISDIYSRAVTAHIFENLYDYDHLARSVRLGPPIRARLEVPARR